VIRVRAETLNSKVSSSEGSPNLGPPTVTSGQNRFASRPEVTPANCLFQKQEAPCEASAVHFQSIEVGAGGDTARRPDRRMASLAKP